MAENETRVEELTARVELAGTVAQEIGWAWRGNWSDFDGRTLRGQLDEWRDKVLLTALDLDGDLEAAISRFRSACDLCPVGNGHWQDYCDEACTEGSTHA